MERSSNPVLKNNIFTKAGSVDPALAMTIQGTVNKTLFLLGLVLLTAVWSWANPAKLLSWFWLLAIAGLVVALVTVFKKEWSAVTAPVYAMVEGFILGGLSVLMEKSYPGIVIQAVGLTFGTLFCLLMAYKSGLIKATENFKLGVIAATGAVALVYIVDIGMGFFGVRIPFIHESGLMGIIFSAVVVVIAALNLVLDFDFIEKGAQANAPKYMEWYGAFGLMVTLIWLYLEILRLLVKTRRR
ncbi:MAG: Bax inhibitor-1/YccA family protein [Candidatus Omnitrophica bacterium]|jgi:uncharacterized YccA/Bax inhibitor family protein|nr:Bax inhibitor-1/YccA family protein [Candidatus Omnitrophota bacterium]MDD5079569.1 Bax inhibitor-1/YccA family protein [Candidatus Omnitrophota bacterium]